MSDTSKKRPREEPSTHPCHNLSNVSQKLFLCRHCMTKFGDPIQRWRHSKTCKKVINTNPSIEIQTIESDIYDSETASDVSLPLAQEEEDSDGEDIQSIKKMRKAVLSSKNFKCQICKTDFPSLDAMREHVKQGCSKPLNATYKTGSTILDASAVQAHLRNMKGSDIDAIVANQIESLLKAAQVLQQQQPQRGDGSITSSLAEHLKKQQMAEQQKAAQNLISMLPQNSNLYVQSEDGETHYILPSDSMAAFDQQRDEPVTVETVASIENIVHIPEDREMIQADNSPDNTYIVNTPITTSMHQVEQTSRHIDSAVASNMYVYTDDNNSENVVIVRTNDDSSQDDPRDGLIQYISYSVEDCTVGGENTIITEQVSEPFIDNIMTQYHVTCSTEQDGAGLASLPEEVQQVILLQQQQQQHIATNAGDGNANEVKLDRKLISEKTKASLLRKILTNYEKAGIESSKSSLILMPKKTEMQSECNTCNFSINSLNYSSSCKNCEGLVCECSASSSCYSLGKTICNSSHEALASHNAPENKCVSLSMQNNQLLVSSSCVVNSSACGVPSLACLASKQLGSLEARILGLSSSLSGDNIQSTKSHLSSGTSTTNCINSVVCSSLESFSPGESNISPPGSPSPQTATCICCGVQDSPENLHKLNIPISVFSRNISPPRNCSKQLFKEPLNWDLCDRTDQVADSISSKANFQIGEVLCSVTKENLVCETSNSTLDSAHSLADKADVGIYKDKGKVCENNDAKVCENNEANVFENKEGKEVCENKKGKILENNQLDLSVSESMICVVPSACVSIMEHSQQSQDGSERKGEHLHESELCSSSQEMAGNIGHDITMTLTQVVDDDNRLLSFSTDSDRTLLTNSCGDGTQIHVHVREMEENIESLEIVAPADQPDVNFTQMQEIDYQSHCSSKPATCMNNIMKDIIVLLVEEFVKEEMSHVVTDVCEAFCDNQGDQESVCSPNDNCDERTTCKDDQLNGSSDEHRISLTTTDSCYLPRGSVEHAQVDSVSEVSSVSCSINSNSSDKIIISEHSLLHESTDGMKDESDETESHFSGGKGIPTCTLEQCATVSQNVSSEVIQRMEIQVPAGCGNESDLPLEQDSKQEKDAAKTSVKNALKENTNPQRKVYPMRQRSVTSKKLEFDQTLKRKKSFSENRAGKNKKLKGKTEASCTNQVENCDSSKSENQQERFSIQEGSEIMEDAPCGSDLEVADTLPESVNHQQINIEAPTQIPEGKPVERKMSPQNKEYDMHESADACGKLDEENSKSKSQLKTIKQSQAKSKSKTLKEPKCKICDKIFKTVQLLQKHNKYPCVIKHTRNLCQKVLRPKRRIELKENLLNSANNNKKDKLSSKKMKMKSQIERPHLLPVRKFTDTTVEIPKNKKAKKTKKKVLPPFVCVPFVKEYKNPHVGVHIVYQEVPFEEQFFFDLGMIKSTYLMPQCLMETTASIPGSNILEHTCIGINEPAHRETKDSGSRDPEQEEEPERPLTPPPELEKIIFVDVEPVGGGPLNSCDELSPPVLEAMSRHLSPKKSLLSPKDKTFNIGECHSFKSVSELSFASDAVTDNTKLLVDKNDGESQGGNSGETPPPILCDCSNKCTNKHVQPLVLLQDICHSSGKKGAHADLKEEKTKNRKKTKVKNVVIKKRSLVNAKHKLKEGKSKMFTKIKKKELSDKTGEANLITVLHNKISLKKKCFKNSVKNNLKDFKDNKDMKNFSKGAKTLKSNAKPSKTEKIIRKKKIKNVSGKNVDKVTTSTTRNETLLGTVRISAEGSFANTFTINADVKLNSNDSTVFSDKKGLQEPFVTISNEAPKADMSKKVSADGSHVSSNIVLKDSSSAHVIPQTVSNGSSNTVHQESLAKDPENPQILDAPVQTCENHEKSDSDNHEISGGSLKSENISQLEEEKMKSPQKGDTKKPSFVWDLDSDGEENVSNVSNSETGKASNNTCVVQNSVCVGTGTDDLLISSDEDEDVSSGSSSDELEMNYAKIRQSIHNKKLHSKRKYVSSKSADVGTDYFVGGSDNNADDDTHVSLSPEQTKIQHMSKKKAERNVTHSKRVYERRNPKERTDNVLKMAKTTVNCENLTNDSVQKNKEGSLSLEQKTPEIGLDFEKNSDTALDFEERMKLVNKRRILNSRSSKLWNNLNPQVHATSPVLENNTQSQNILPNNELSKNSKRKTESFAVSSKQSEKKRCVNKKPVTTSSVPKKCPAESSQSSSKCFTGSSTESAGVLSDKQSSQIVDNSSDGINKITERDSTLMKEPSKTQGNEPKEQSATKKLIDTYKNIAGEHLTASYVVLDKLHFPVVRDVREENDKCAMNLVKDAVNIEGYSTSAESNQIKVACGEQHWEILSEKREQVSRIVTSVEKEEMIIKSSEQVHNGNGTPKSLIGKECGRHFMDAIENSGVLDSSRKVCSTDNNKNDNSVSHSHAFANVCTDESKDIAKDKDKSISNALSPEKQKTQNSSICNSSRNLFDKFMNASPLKDVSHESKTEAGNKNRYVEIQRKNIFPHSEKVEQCQVNEVRVFPPPGTKIITKEKERSAPEFFSRTAAEEPTTITNSEGKKVDLDVEAKTKLLTILAESLGILPKVVKEKIPAVKKVPLAVQIPKAEEDNIELVVPGKGEEEDGGDECNTINVISVPPEPNVKHYLTTFQQHTPMTSEGISRAVHLGKEDSSLSSAEQFELFEGVSQGKTANFASSDENRSNVSEDLVKESSCMVESEQNQKVRTDSSGGKSGQENMEVESELDPELNTHNIDSCVGGPVYCDIHLTSQNTVTPTHKINPKTEKSKGRKIPENVNVSVVMCGVEDLKKAEDKEDYILIPKSQLTSKSNAEILWDQAFGSCEGSPADLSKKSKGLYKKVLVSEGINIQSEERRVKRQIKGDNQSLNGSDEITKRDDARTLLPCGNNIHVVENESSLNQNPSNTVSVVSDNDNCKDIVQ